MNDAITKALETWYEPDHPLHYDPLHPAIGLAGEAGELLDLYKKERFKDGVSWWDCKYCGNSEDWHSKHNSYCEGWWHKKEQVTIYTPKILDELGDAWFYIRILAYQADIDLNKWLLDKERIVPDDKLMQLIHLNYNASIILLNVEETGYIPTGRLSTLYRWFQDLLVSLDFTLDQVTDQNYQKLKDGDNHGWSTARKSPEKR